MAQYDVNADEHEEPRRWICWPDFDMVCVQGGCVHCGPDGDPVVATKTRRQILNKARSRGMDVLEVSRSLDMTARLVRA